MEHEAIGWSVEGDCAFEVGNEDVVPELLDYGGNQYGHRGYVDRQEKSWEELAFEVWEEESESDDYEYGLEEEEVAVVGLEGKVDGKGGVGDEADLSGPSIDEGDGDDND